MKTALAVVPAAVILLAGCASGSGAETPAPSGTVAGGDATSASSTSASSTTTSATTSAPTSASPTAADVPTAIPTTFADVNQTITDPDLKDSITVKRVARAMPWPAGYKASAQAYELVGVEMTWTPSKDYTIPIRWQDFAIGTDQPVPQHAGRHRQRGGEGRRVGSCCRTRSTRVTR